MHSVSFYQQLYYNNPELTQRSNVKYQKIVFCYKQNMDASILAVQIQIVYVEV